MILDESSHPTTFDATNSGAKLLFEGSWLDEREVRFVCANSLVPLAAGAASVAISIHGNSEWMGESNKVSNEWREGGREGWI